MYVARFFPARARWKKKRKRERVGGHRGRASRKRGERVVYLAREPMIMMMRDGPARCLLLKRGEVVFGILPENASSPGSNRPGNGNFRFTRPSSVFYSSDRVSKDQLKFGCYLTMKNDFVFSFLKFTPEKF